MRCDKYTRVLNNYIINLKLLYNFYIYLKKRNKAITDNIICVVGTIKDKIKKIDFRENSIYYKIITHNNYT